MREITTVFVSLEDGDVQASVTEDGWICDVPKMQEKLNLEFPPDDFQSGSEPDHVHAAAVAATEANIGEILRIERDGPELDENAIH